MRRMGIVVIPTTKAAPRPMAPLRGVITTSNGTTTATTFSSSLSLRRTVSSGSGSGSIGVDVRIVKGGRSKSSSSSCSRSFSSAAPEDDGGSISKVLPSASAALQQLPLSKWDGIRVGVGGFGLGGVPESLLHALAEFEPACHLTVSSLTGGTDAQGIGVLLQVPHKVKRLMSSYVGENKLLEQMYFDGRLELELVPQGTLAERWNAAGYGIPAFYTPTGAGTLYARGGLPIRHDPESKQVVLASDPKETRVFDDDGDGGIEYVMERSLPTDLSLVKAAIADTLGNCRFVGTSQNSNPDCAKAATQFCLVEAESIVEAGSIHPDDVHLPGIYVHAVVPATTNLKPIERLKLQQKQKQSSSSATSAPAPLVAVDTTNGRTLILRRAAREFQNGMYVNLGIGLPTLASNFVPPHVTILLQTENGLLGMGPYPAHAGEASPDWINAGKETITALPGASAFSSSASFGMIRAGRIDLTLLGGLQVSHKGDLASWTVPGKIIKGMGGAMDLVGAPRSRVVVTMDHVAKDGTPKIVDECSLPLTGHAVVDRIITDMGVFDCDKHGGSGLTLVEIAPNRTLHEVREATGCDFKVASDPIPIMVDEP
jgi:3-oxoacid CoA-transferase